MNQDDVTGTGHPAETFTITLNNIGADDQFITDPTDVRFPISDGGDADTGTDADDATETQQPERNPLIPMVEVLVHPIDQAEHPTYQAGYRWAVMVGGVPVHDLDYCASAGHAEDLNQACVDGETVGAAAARALRMLGIPVCYSFRRLDWDPIPASADNRPLIRLDR